MMARAVQADKLSATMLAAAALMAGKLLVTTRAAAALMVDKSPMMLQVAHLTVARLSRRLQTIQALTTQPLLL